MPNPSATAWSSSASRAWFPRAICACAVVFVLVTVTLRWDRASGFTPLIAFGENWAPQRLPALKDLPVATVPGGGYDGQFYAQIAVQPEPTSPVVQKALDNPAYRFRRILLPLLAHVLGGGQPWAILNIYALLNLAAWLWLAAIWWVEVGASTKFGAAVWLACLLSLGALDSVRLSLTDLPATLCLVLAVRAMQKSRPKLATLWFLAGGLVRETSIFAGMVFPNGKTPAARVWLWRGLAVAPVMAWTVWLWLYMPGDSGAQVLAWPGVGVVEHLATCARQIAAGNFDSRYVFGLIGALGLAYQSLFLLTSWRESDPWTRLGLPFAVLFWCLSPYVFSGYWAAARAVLPLTFAFNRLLPRDRSFWFHFIAGNLFMLHGIWRMLP
jgi:hypothetical protein